MTRLVNLGSAPDDGTGDSLRVAFGKYNDTVADVAAAVAEVETKEDAGTADSAVSTHNDDAGAHGQTATGRALVTAVDAAAGRTAISAEQSGAAASAVSAHTSSGSAHPASAVTYSNASSGLAATDAQAAIDEIVASGVGGDIATHNASTAAHGQTATGRALVTAVDAAAGRTALGLADPTSYARKDTTTTQVFAGNLDQTGRNSYHRPTAANDYVLHHTGYVDTDNRGSYMAVYGPTHPTTPGRVQWLFSWVGGVSSHGGQIDVRPDLGYINLIGPSSAPDEVRVNGNRVLTTLDDDDAYTSPEQSIVAAGLVTLAHGLAARPNEILFYLVNKTAEHGYSVGDVFGPFMANDANGLSTGRGLSVVADATNINIRYGDETAVFVPTNFSAGASVGITPANWRLIVRAKV